MAISKKPDVPQEERFIGGAPDGTPPMPQRAPGRLRMGKKLQISITITEELLDRVDAMAKDYGQSRAGFISLALKQALERGMQFGGEREKE